MVFEKFVTPLSSLFTTMVWLIIWPPWAEAFSMPSGQTITIRVHLRYVCFGIMPSCEQSLSSLFSHWTFRPQLLSSHLTDTYRWLFYMLCNCTYMNVYMHICLDVILQRKWAVLSLGQQVSIRPHVFNPQQDYLGAMVVEVDFLMKKKFVASYGCA